MVEKSTSVTLTVSVRTCQGCQIKIFKIRSFPKKIRSLSGDFLSQIRRKIRRFFMKSQRLSNDILTD